MPNWAPEQPAAEITIDRGPAFLERTNLLQDHAELRDLALLSGDVPILSQVHGALDAHGILVLHASEGLVGAARGRVERHAGVLLQRAIAIRAAAVVLCRRRGGAVGSS